MREEASEDGIELSVWYYYIGHSRVRLGPGKEI